MSEEIKNKFIEEYSNFKTLDDSNRIIQELVIPNFETLACDLDEIIDQINSKYDITFESLDFIEMIFNPNLYQVIMSEMKSNQSEDCLKHYLIVLIEFTKYQRYITLNEKLRLLGSDDKMNKTIFYEGLSHASDERIESCLNRIKSIYQTLNNDFPTFHTSKLAINILLSSNDLTEKINV
jgi:hypothetical protein